MSDFIISEAVDVDNTDDNNENTEDIATVSDDEFIDDSEQPESGYHYFTNVTKSYDDAMQDAMRDIDNLEARHYFDSDEEEEELNEFANFKAKVKLFKESLIAPHGLENPDSFFYSILYAIRHKLTQKVDFVEQEDVLKQDVSLALYVDLFEIKSLLRLDGEDILNFENQCFKINTILSKHSMFLRVFELKDKFRYLIKQDSQQKNVFREVSACVVERFNGFTIVRLEFDNEIRK